MPKQAVQKIDIVWFKRDLRVQDHAPLEAASQTGNSVLPLYVVEDDYWAQPFASERHWICLLYTSPSPRDVEESRMPSSA